MRNDLRYFYAVTAFDINSIQSGPSSLESPRRTKPVTPASSASNLERSGTVAGHPRSAAASPSTRRARSRRSTPAPAASADRSRLPTALHSGWRIWSQTLLPDSRSGSVSLTLDSLQLGSAYEHGAGEPGLPAHLLSDVARERRRPFDSQVPVVQDQTSDLRSRLQLRRCRPGGGSRQRAGSAAGAGFQLRGRLDLELPGNYYTSSWGRGCRNAAAGFAADGTTGCEYNGPRWFDGPSPQRNETRPTRSPRTRPTRPRPVRWPISTTPARSPAWPRSRCPTPTRRPRPVIASSKAC